MINLSWIDKIAIILFIPSLFFVRNFYCRLKDEGLYIDWSGVGIVLFSSAIGIGLSVLLHFCFG